MGQEVLLLSHAAHPKQLCTQLQCPWGPCSRPDSGSRIMKREHSGRRHITGNVSLPKLAKGFTSVSGCARQRHANANPVYYLVHRFHAAGRRAAVQRTWGRLTAHVAPTATISQEEIFGSLSRSALRKLWPSQEKPSSVCDIRRQDRRSKAEVAGRKSVHQSQVHGSDCGRASFRRLRAVDNRSKAGGRISGCCLPKGS